MIYLIMVNGNVNAYLRIDEKPRKPAPLKRQREEEDSSDSTPDEVEPKPKVIDLKDNYNNLFT